MTERTPSGRRQPSVRELMKQELDRREKTSYEFKHHTHDIDVVFLSPPSRSVPKKSKSTSSASREKSPRCLKQYPCTPTRSDIVLRTSPCHLVPKPSKSDSSDTQRRRNHWSLPSKVGTLAVHQPYSPTKPSIRTSPRSVYANAQTSFDTTSPMMTKPSPLRRKQSRRGIDMGRPSLGRSRSDTVTVKSLVQRVFLSKQQQSSPTSP